MISVIRIGGSLSECAAELFYEEIVIFIVNVFGYCSELIVLF